MWSTLWIYLKIPAIGTLTELSKDGLYSLFHAFFSNELSYNDFYLMRPDADTVATLAPLMASDARRVGDPASLAYEVTPHEKEIRANVIIVLMESMGSEFFSEFRDDGKKLTPELEKLASESLYFSHVYSTGTRTVRGIEALTLARPPLPGHAHRAAAGQRQPARHLERVP